MKKYIALLVTGMVLAGSVSAGKFITPPVLRKGNPACSQNKNCGLGKPANPINRGCSVSQRCKRG